MAKFGTSLTVRDLIAKLQTMPPDTEVIGFDGDHCSTCSVTGVELNVINGEYAEEIPDPDDLEGYCEYKGLDIEEAKFLLTKTRVCVVHVDTSYSYSDGSDMGEE